MFHSSFGWYPSLFKPFRRLGKQSVLKMNDTVNAHAYRYATETAKIFLLDLYRAKFPHYFEHVDIQTRPATSDDYYVPASLQQECIVVERLSFTEIGCRRFSCYPFKKDWEPCTEADLPHWIAMGSQFELACAPSCQDHALTAEWVRGQCILANPQKKLVASMPEKLFESEARNLYHGGIDAIEGTLTLNERYCAAYGLDFVEEDCYVSGGQSFGEFLLGKTTIRAAKAAHIPPFKASPPALPAYLNYAPRRKRRAVDPPRSRRKRQIRGDQDELMKEVAVELAKELGQEIAQSAIEMLLKKKIPQFLNAAVDRLAAKCVIKQSIASILKTAGTAAIRGLGKAFGYATIVLAVYDVTVGILDILDTFHYNKVLDKAQIQEIDKQLDYRYFQDGPIRPELTPAYVWDNNVLVGEDDTAELFVFMSERVGEYWTALRTQPSSVLKHIPLKEKKNLWDSKVFTVCVLASIVVVLLTVERIHMWAVCLLFLKVYFQI